MRHAGGTGGSSRKYHTGFRGRNSRSHYPARLKARGFSKAPALATVESLRKRQAWMLPYITEAMELAKATGEAYRSTIPATRPKDSYTEDELAAEAA